MKKLISIILLIAVLVSLCACGKKEQAKATAPVAEPATEATLDPASPEAMYGHIDQTQKVDGVYKIWNAEGVQNMLKNPSESFELLCHVDMAGATIAPMAEFTGTLNGANFTIKNFTVQGGDEINFGFIGVNKGDVSNLYLENVTLVSGTNAKNIGAYAGINEGTLSRCNSTDVTLTAAVAADANVGNVVGLNKGVISNGKYDVDLAVTASGNTNMGAITGTAQGGRIEFVEIEGKMDATGGNVTAGMFAGSATDVIFQECRFLCATNTVNGKLVEVFTGNEDDELVTCAGALYRDNGHQMPLTESQEKVRQRVVDEMNAMARLEWHLHEDLTHSCECTLAVCHGVFNTTYTYYGIPYNHKGGSLERMKYILDEDGYIEDWVYDLATFDGYDVYMGNDCSAAVSHAWWTVSNSVDFARVRYMVPGLEHSANLKSGCYPVGINDYAPGTGWWVNVVVDSDILTDDFFEVNSEQEMLEAYALMRKGDAYSYMNLAGGHTRMAVEDPVVVRDQQGLINSGYSYVISTEQGSHTVDDINKTYTTWKYRYKYTFGSLLDDWAVPVTCEELLTGEMEPAECKLLDGADGIAGMYTGTVKANYYLDSVNMTIVNSKGKEVMNHTMWATVDKKANVANDGMLRNYLDAYDLANFAMPLSKIQLEIGETYTYTITGNLHTYDSFVVKEASFVYGQA